MVRLGHMDDAYDNGFKAENEFKERAGEEFFQMMVEMSPQQVWDK